LLNLDRNELGQPLASLGHWTGTREGGLGGNACGGFTSASSALQGSYGWAARRWISYGELPCNDETKYSLLCLED